MSSKDLERPSLLVEETIEYARIEWVPPLRGAQPRISGSCFFAMIDWIPSEGGTHSEWVPPLREGHNTEFLGSAFLP